MSEYLTVLQVADLAQLEHKTVRRAIAGGRLLAFRVENRLRIREEDARAWIEGRPVLATAPPRPQPRARPSTRATARGSVADLKRIEEAMAS